MTEIEQHRAENTALYDAIEIIAKNLTQSDGIDPEGWWLELTADEAALIRSVVEKNKAVPFPDLLPRCKHGTLIDHCPDCAPDMAEVERNEAEQAKHRPGTSGGTY